MSTPSALNVPLRTPFATLPVGTRVITSSVKSSTVRHKLELGAVVAVCWNYDSGLDRARAAPFRRVRGGWHGPGFLVQSAVA
jgi:hypothetical protein